MEELSNMLGVPFTVREPSADVRQSASMLHQFYTAYRLEGFTEQQAMQLVCAIVRPHPQP